MEYKFQEIEEKWQSWWEENDTYHVDNNSDKPKYYVLDMFPYPSGSGLHVGHPLGYVASDIYARYKRLTGFNVLHPMGFDAFGLPAEQYAIEQGKHPETTTNENIVYFKKQLRGIGFNYDWKRAVNTSDPKYYKWTQWIFLQLFNSCLMFQAFANIWFCPALGTVLANDEVKDGVSERGGHPVEKRKLRQWFLRTTAYAERLINDLETLEWSDSLKEMQRNWIGKSHGASMWFDIIETDKKFEIFTTRPDTIFGATFMVLAPEHELVSEITTAEQKAEISEYLKYVNSRSELERVSEVKTVTGAFTGAYAKHPFSGEPVPIYISEYVLASYGTGAIMAVPSDDDRDEAFATKFNIPIIDVIDKSKYPNSTKADKEGIMINSDFMNGMEVPDAITEAVKRMEAMGIGTGKINYRLRDAGFSRQRYWGEPFPIVYNSEDTDALPEAINESELPLGLPVTDNFKPNDDGKSPLQKIRSWIEVDGKFRESDTMPGYAGSSWYFLRYMDPDNEDFFVSKDAEAYWQNVDLYIGGTEHAVGHLLYSRTWHKFFYDKGWVSTQEPFKKLVNQGMIQGVSSKVYRSKENVNKYISKDENAEFELEDGKYICGAEVEKMSKSKHNTVDPLEVIEKYGADTLRMFEMFLGPIEQHKPWDMQGIGGVSKFVRKFWGLFHKAEKFNISDEKATENELKTLHKTIKKITGDIERFSFNTCISSFMICTNELDKLKCNKREILTPLVILLAPFAPYVTEELWHKLGNHESIHHASYPTHDESILVESNFEYPVMINGKMKGKISLPLTLEEAEAKEAVLAHEPIKKLVDGKPLKRFIYVKGKIVNMVV
ncbi:UNVERIFIED_CONTAM: hypothetical protein GTU68_023182 [Idotea baltica]|nr:hypothetical protein [Idotea baltica]